MTETVDKSVQSYDIETELGRDDLTIAYSARRKSDGLPVLIRVVAPQFVFDTFFVRRFIDAVSRSMKLEHPNIVKVYEVAERDDIVYIAREWVEADSLTKYLEKHGPIPVQKTIGLVEQLASALDYAHTQGVKHGDLTAGSIFVADDHIWITDFGLLMAMDGTSLVKKGFGVGNPVYLAPERVRGETSSRTSDLYALGIVCYQMLTGQPPFVGEAPAVLHAQAYEQPALLHEVNTKIKPAVSEVVLRMLSKGLELRYNTGSEFVAALRASAERTAPIKPQEVKEKVAPAEAPQRAPERNKQLLLWALILTPLIGLALAAGFWVMSQWLNDISDRGRQSPTAGQALQTANVPPTDLTPVSRLKQEDTPVEEVLPPFENQPATTPADTLAPQSDAQAPSPLPVNTPVPAQAPALVSLPSEPTVADDSPFTNLILTQNINDALQPVNPTNIFDPASGPIYLFFDYDTISPGTAWRQTWKWDDVVLQQQEDVWPEEYGPVGTAWIYFAPAAGFNPGPYSIVLEVEGQEVASINFIVQPGSQ
jgi:serine/threonine protein kinase